MTTRQDFTDKMIATLKIGGDNLTLADMNEEGANMLMLQTRQALGIQSLSMASQSAQQVLSALSVEALPNQGGAKPLPFTLAHHSMGSSEITL